MTVGDEDITCRRDDYIARRREMIWPASLGRGRSQRQQHLPCGAELDDDVPALVAFGDTVARHRFGHPDISFAIHVKAVRPDENAASKRLRDLPVWSELHDGIGLRIAAFVAEARRILESFAADDSPDMLAIRVDDHLADCAHRSAIRQLRPAFSNAIGIREPLRMERCVRGERRGNGERTKYTGGTCTDHDSTPRLTGMVAGSVGCLNWGRVFRLC